MRRVLLTMLLLLAAAPTFAQEDPPPHPAHGGAATAELRRPATIAEARSMAIGSEYGPEETEAALPRIEAWVREGEMLRHAADDAERVGIRALELLMRIAATSHSPRVQSDAIYCVWEIRPRVFRTETGQRALSEMLDWLEEAPDDATLVESASAGIAPAFRSAGPAAMPLIPRLSDLSQSPKPLVRRTAVRCLRYMRRFAYDATDDLIRALQDADAETRIHAVWALAGRHDRTSGLTGLINAAGDHADKRVGQQVRRAVHHHIFVNRHRPKGGDWVMPYPELTDGAIYLGPGTEGGPETDSADAAPDLPKQEAALPDDVAGLVGALDDPKTATTAEDRLTELGPLAHAALPLLVLHLDDPDRTRAPSIRLLAAIGGDDPQVIAELIAVAEGLGRHRNLSHHAAEDTQAHAIQALGRLGPRAEAALPMLRLATLSTNSDIEISAALAIKQIDDGAEER